MIYVVWSVVSREIFFQGDNVGGAYNSVFEIHLRIKLMIHDRSQLSGWQWSIHNGGSSKHLFNLKYDYLGCTRLGALSCTV